MTSILCVCCFPWEIFLLAISAEKILVSTSRSDTSAIDSHRNSSDAYRATSGGVYTRPQRYFLCWEVSAIKRKKVVRSLRHRYGCNNWHCCSSQPVRSQKKKPHADLSITWNHRRITKTSPTSTPGWLLLPMGPYNSPGRVHLNEVKENVCFQRLFRYIPTANKKKEETTRCL